MAKEIESILDDEKVLRIRLLSLMKIHPYNYSELAKGVGITAHTLKNFLYQKNKTSLKMITLIRMFVEKKEAEFAKVLKKKGVK